MVNNCEICGKAFSSANPRYTVNGQIVCKSCKSKYERADHSAEAEEIERRRKEAEAARIKELNEKMEAAQEEIRSQNPKIIFSLDGSRGKHIDIYEDKCVITTSVTVGSVLSGNATDGEKTIYYIDVIGLQYKASGFVIGYIQFETASGQMNNGSSNFWGENSFVNDTSMTELTNEYMEKVVTYVKERIDFIKKAQVKQLSATTVSPADEILKYKNLLDIGAITSDEYEAKKKQLLDL